MPRQGRHRAGAGALYVMTTNSDGGWCAIALNVNRATGFTGGNVVDSPRHGEVRISHYPVRSLIEYRAAAGYAGPDNFSVTLIPGNSTYLVDVTVRP